MAREIFTEIPEDVKDKTKFWFEVAFSQINIADTIRMLKEYRNSCENEYERDYVDFYFNMRMAQINGEEGE